MESVDTRFDEWVKYLFDRPVVGRPEYVDLGDSEPPAGESVGYLTRLFADPESILAKYSDAQITQGLWQFLYAHSTGYLWNLLDPQVPWSERRACLNSIATVFERLFAKRCGEHLFWDAQTAENPLCEVCFLWWDMFPTWGDAGDATRASVDREILAVIIRILALDSIPCQQSALHGLGHWQTEYSSIAATAIDEFLASNVDISPELREYAESARRGDVL